MTQIMKVRWVVGWVMILMLVAAIGYAQQPAAAAAPAASPAAPVEGRTLGLAEALEIARRNNPDYLTILNNRSPASAFERSSLLGLITPTASISAGTRRTNAGTTVITGFAQPINSPGTSSTSWGISLNYFLSGATLSNRGLATATMRSADADAAGAQIVLETNVRAQYLILLETIATQNLAQRSLERSTENLNLAQAKYSVGQGTLIDVRSAEVAKGQAEVDLLTARQAVGNQTLVLFQYLGVPAPVGVPVVPTDSFPVTQPAFSEDSLIRLALAENPGLISLRARESWASWNTRSAYSQYGPSLQANASYGGYRQSIDSNTTSGAPPSSLSGKSPWSLFIGVQMPIYDAFSRATNIQQARADEDDARLAIRSRELNVRAVVSAAYGALVVAYQKIGLQQHNKVAAAEALDLATQRYRVGSGTYLELLTSRVTADTADRDYVFAIYDYHRAIATLENAVGRPLR